MEEIISRWRILHVYPCLLLLLHSPSSDALRMDGPRPPPAVNPNALMKMILDMVTPLDGSPSPNTGPYVASPFTIPPYDSLSPMPLPQNAPPFCLYPPSPQYTPPSAAGTGSTPIPPEYTPPPSGAAGGFNPGPPSGGGGGAGGFSPIPPEYTPPSGGAGVPPEYNPPSGGGGGSPPENNPPSSGSGAGFSPIPPEYTPPSGGGYGPPEYAGGGGSPPQNNPPSGGSGGGGGFSPGPPSGGGGGGGGPVFLPPIVYPAPAVPPPPYTGPKQALWCVVKPSVPEPIIMEALNYACASGAECSEIVEGGACFQPNTVAAHASYAFNSYWQRTKVAGGSCGFGGIAIIVSVDPSYDKCHFMYV